MSSLWQECDGNRWTAVPLVEGPGGPMELAGLRFLGFGRGAERRVALLAPPALAVWVNGVPVLAGLRVLEHRDEVLVGRERLFFSAESTPIATVFAAKPGSRTPTCPVCRGPVRDGERAVQCPGCARWFHEIEKTETRPAKPCWTYAPTCRFCNHPTAMTGAAAWTPEMEERRD